VSEIQKYNLQPKELYKLYINVLPKGKQWLKYIKGRNQMDYPNWLINIVANHEEISKKEIDVIMTTGGTGLTGRDITPEALDEIADKHIPGFGEIFRMISLGTVGTSSIQSRACAVLAKGKYVFVLPGSSGGVTDAWDKILKFQLDINHKPCNFVELFPRLKEK